MLSSSEYSFLNAITFVVLFFWFEANIEL